LFYLQELHERLELSANVQRPAPAQPQLPTTTMLPRALLSPDEQAVLALATTQGQVTARLLMSQLHISKATATRRLATLTQSGLLVKRGRGRGTCYLPASAANGGTESTGDSTVIASGQRLAPTDALDLQTLLEPHLHQLRDEYHVTEIVLLRTEVAGAPICQLGVAFRQPSTVRNFFELEQTLATWCARPVDLLPLALLEAEDVAATSRLVLAATTGQ